VLSLALAIAMFPVVSLVGPLFDMWRTFHLFNTWPGLIIPYMTFTLPLAIWVLSAFFREIPVGRWSRRSGRRGTVVAGVLEGDRARLRLRVWFTCAILTFFFAWNEFVLADLADVDARSSRRCRRRCPFFVGPTRSTRPTSQLAAASVIVTIR
jgi:multiple sugar transport system permease protein